MKRTTQSVSFVTYTFQPAEVIAALISYFGKEVPGPLPEPTPEILGVDKEVSLVYEYPEEPENNDLESEDEE